MVSRGNRIRTLALEWGSREDDTFSGWRCPEPPKGRELAACAKVHLLRALLVAVVLPVIGLTGCTALRDFVIPPETQGHVSSRKAVARFASLIVHNVLVDGRPAAIALRAGRVAAVTSMQAMGPYRGQSTRVVDGRGGTAMAGLVDAEVDLVRAAMLRDAVDLRGITDETELGRRLRAGADLLRGDDWTAVRGVDEGMARRLSADDLARLAPGVPALLTFANSDGALVSRAMLTLLPAELRRQIEARRGRIGARLTRAVLRRLPEPRLSRLKPLLVQVLTELRDRGVTTLHVMGASPLVWRTLVEIERDHRLDLRCHIYLDGHHQGTERALQEREQRSRARGRDLRVPGAWQPRQAKLVGVEYWLDGGLADRSAALVSDYADGPGRGLTLPPDAKVLGWLRRLDRLNLQLALHASGDAALRQALRVVEGAQRPAGARPIRLNQVTVVPPELLARLGKLNAVFGLVTATSGGATTASARLGAQRQAWAAQGVHLAEACTVLLGSGLPIGHGQTWLAFQALVGANASGQPWTVSAALSAMTTGPGGERLGLAVGAPGDLVIWDRPWSAQGPAPHPAMVIVDGAMVRHAPDRPPASSAPAAEPELPADPPKATPPAAP